VTESDQFESHHDRFLLSRAAYMWSSQCGDRLLTTGTTWHQRASRAFAAQFLAPQDTLAGRIGGLTATDEDVDALAKEFDVSPLVVGHQLENRGISTL
ncbi:MAG: hypothetical protein ACNA8W_23980, partial [Bradymonadaceae bacterium]